jgi:hypothetical protein
MCPNLMMNPWNSFQQSEHAKLVEKYQKPIFVKFQLIVDLAVKLFRTLLNLCITLHVIALDCEFLGGHLNYQARSKDNHL